MQQVDGAALVPVGAEFPLLLVAIVFRNHYIRRTQNAFRRAVIDVQIHRLMIWERFVEHPESAVRCPSKAVDGLVVVADGGEVIRRLEQPFQQLNLRVIGILEFIHQHIVKPLAVVFPHLWLTIEKTNRFRNQAAQARASGLLHQQPAVPEDPRQFLLLLNLLLQQRALGSVQGRRQCGEFSFQPLRIALKIRRLNQLVLAA